MVKRGGTLGKSRLEVIDHHAFERWEEEQKIIFLTNMLKSLKNAGWTNREIAEYIPGSAGSVSFVLRGVRNPPLSWFDGLREANMEYSD